MNYFKKISLISFALILPIIGLGFFIFSKKTNFQIEPGRVAQSDKNAATGEKIKNLFNTDIEPQKPLANPPEIIKAIYLTAWSAATESRINYLLNLAKNGKINAAVIDIKDFSGYVSYNIDLSQVEEYRTKEIKIKNINSLIKRLHDQNVYVIARITVFQDPALAKARPDLAVKKKSNASSTPPYPTWYDKKGLAWSNPTLKEVWDYNIAIAKDAANRGFDEINFDYIRFPSDGDMSSMYFSSLDSKTSKAKIIANFFKYLRESLPDVKISADVFGLVAIKKDDLGIGQILEDIYKYFDYVCPMVYPSHYYSGTLGYKNPAEHPYEVVKYSLDEAVNRLNALKIVLNPTQTASSATPGPEQTSLKSRNLAKIRPWLQDFNLGANYTSEMVRAEIKAVLDSLGENYSGFMLWNPSNVYTKEAL